MANIALTATLTSTTRLTRSQTRPVLVTATHSATAIRPPTLVVGRKRPKAATVSNVDAENTLDPTGLYGQLWAHGRQRPQSDTPAAL